MEIKELKSHKSQICERILRALPQWFGIEQAIVNYATEVRDMTMFGISDGDDVVGFAALNFHNDKTAEIHVMGILSDYHRQGLGKSLVQHCEDYLREKGYRFLTVKTLGPSRENDEYARTRKFYEDVGFYPLEEFKTLWGEANPCLFMVKSLT